jgi:hypothetical protein
LAWHIPASQREVAGAVDPFGRHFREFPSLRLRKANNPGSFRARSRMRAAQGYPRTGGMADDKLSSDCGVTAHPTGVLRTQA